MRVARRRAPERPGGYWEEREPLWARGGRKRGQPATAKGSGYEHPSGIGVFRGYPSNTRATVAFTIDGHADVIFVPEVDGSYRLIYKGDLSIVPDRLLSALLPCVSGLIPDDAPVTMWWPEGFERFLECGRLHFWEMLDLSARGTEGRAAELASLTGLEVDANANLIKGPFSKFNRYEWGASLSDRVILEIAVGTTSGLTGRAAYEVIADIARKVMARLKARDEKVDEWRIDNGYL